MTHRAVAGALHLFRQAAKFAGVNGRGDAFNDFDGMPLGVIGCGLGKDPDGPGPLGNRRMTRYTPAELRSIVSLYAIACSPMILESHGPHRRASTRRRCSYLPTARSWRSTSTESPLAKPSHHVARITPVGPQCRLRRRWLWTACMSHSLTSTQHRPRQPWLSPTSGSNQATILPTTCAMCGST